MLYLYSVAPKDGTTIGLVHSSVPFAPLYGTRGANFDPRQMHWIGSITSAFGICVSWAKSGITHVGAHVRARVHRRRHRRRLADGNHADDAQAAVRRQDQGSCPATRAATTSISRWSAARCTAAAAGSSPRSSRRGRTGSRRRRSRCRSRSRSSAIAEFPDSAGGDRVRQGRAHPADPRADPVAVRDGPADAGAARHAARAGRGACARRSARRCAIPASSRKRKSRTSRSRKSPASASPRCSRRAYAMPPEVIKAANEAMNLTGTQ